MRKTADGASEKDHQVSAARQWEKLGKKPNVRAEDTGPQLPDQIEYLWLWFLQILKGLDGGGFGPAAVSWVSLRAWCDLTGNVLEPWEAAALVELGALRTEIIAEKLNKKGK